jgi:hypothetical protein
MSGETAVESRRSGLAFGKSDILSTTSGKADAKVEGESKAPVASQLTLLGEFKDAVSSRTALMVIGVLLQLGFILSYVGAFHSTKPVRIPVGVVAPVSVGPSSPTESMASMASPSRREKSVMQLRRVAR